MPANDTQKIKIQVIHGPNLNLLGKRQPEIYGYATLAEINTQLHALAQSLDIEINCLQTNHEGHIIDCIQDANETHGFVINPAAYTHTSIAIRDAFLAVAKPFVEVHLSNISQRESYRQFSYLSDIAFLVISGQGPKGYTEALKQLVSHLRKGSNAP